jgi:hypothetical protein
MCVIKANVIVFPHEAVQISEIFRRFSIESILLRFVGGYSSDGERSDFRFDA